jgi:hypothetical protein
VVARPKRPRAVGVYRIVNTETEDQVNDRK